MATVAGLTRACICQMLLDVDSTYGGDLSGHVVYGEVVAERLGRTLNQNAKAFGAFGVVIAHFAYILIVVTISMVCAEWRQGENDRKG